MRLHTIDKLNPLLPTFPKAPTDTNGLDEITGGGLPQGRPTLVCGSAGRGKTLFSTELLTCINSPNSPSPNNSWPSRCW